MNLIEINLIFSSFHAQHEDRTTFLAVLGSGLLLMVSFISFGEAWIQWSGDKYAAIFNSFSDNLVN